MSRAYNLCMRARVHGLSTHPFSLPSSRRRKNKNSGCPHYWICAWVGLQFPQAHTPTVYGSACLDVEYFIYLFVFAY